MRDARIGGGFGALSDRPGGIAGRARPAAASAHAGWARPARPGLVAAVAVLALLAGCVAPPAAAPAEGAGGLTIEHFRATATVEDDATAGVATISTANGLPAKRRIAGLSQGENHLRAFIDHKSGRTTLQLVQVIRYQDANWHTYDTIRVETAGGPRVWPLGAVKRESDCVGSRYGCAYLEQVTLDVDEPLLRGIAARAGAGAAADLAFRFESRSGKRFDASMPVAEVAGFLVAIDGYRSAKGLPAPGGR